MRFNAHELACLARQSSDKFDKEGVLFVKEKQDGIFRKGEVYVERLFRLRGNLLFYFKTKEISSDVCGVVVLERCIVQLDEDEDDFYSLTIVFEGEEKVLRLSSPVETERDSWIGRLHIASYECIKIQLQSLREQIRIKTGRDPIDDRMDLLPGSTDGFVGVSSSEGASKADHSSSFIEMSLACRGLPLETNGRAPDTFASVHICHTLGGVGGSAGCGGPWSPHSHTEIVEMTQIGSIILPMAAILDSRGQPVSIGLDSPDANFVGSIVLLAWLSDALPLSPDTPRVSQYNNSTDAHHNTKAPLERCLSIASQYRCKGVEALQDQFANIITKTFRFPVKNTSSDQLLVHEYMGEGRLTFTLPRQLLKLFVEEERSKIEQLQDLGMLTTDWDRARQEAIDYQYSMVTMYEQHARCLATFSSQPPAGCTFKPSAKKAHKEVEFAPTNLHIQRMFVYNTKTTSCKSYDVMTVGAFMAGAQKFKRGGLRRQLAQLDRQYPTFSSTSSDRSRVVVVGDELSHLAEQRSVTDTACDRVCAAAIQGVAATLSAAAEELTMKELTQLNTEAALVCVHSKVEDLISHSSDHCATWLDSLSPLVIKLKRCMEVMCARAKAGLTFLLLQECSLNMSMNHSVTYRRDIVFSQALTAATTGFLLNLIRWSEDRAVLEQLRHVGMLLQFECLLSCHSDELAMIEDMAVGVRDLTKVIFFVERASPGSEPTKMCPNVSGDRSAVFITLELSAKIYDRLPAGFSRDGIHVVPVFFNIGINEQATLAEKFGDVSLQEAINEENYVVLHKYSQRYIEWQTLSSSRDSRYVTRERNLDEQMRLLHINAVTKKSKNVELLHCAAAVCRAMHGARFTSCKSAKDRSAMAVTLEQVQLLQQENDLEPACVLHALECMRSEGVRRENTLKNAGVRKYAFNSLQILSLPKLYRPPSGTYGNCES